MQSNYKLISNSFPYSSLEDKDLLFHFFHEVSVKLN